jgi:hypothetical protein
MPNETDKWVALLKSIMAALEAGDIAADQLKGKTLEEMAELSEAGWDKFDEVIARGEKAGHE